MLYYRVLELFIVIFICDNLRDNYRPNLQFKRDEIKFTYHIKTPPQVKFKKKII